jgi:hypothetical protein
MSNTTRDMANYKPYRTKAQKKLARETARLCNDGTYRSNAPVSYHSKNRLKSSSLKERTHEQGTEP